VLEIEFAGEAPPFAAVRRHQRCRPRTRIT
jgi:hypothetical protein